jgi:hypothetical protein
MPEASVINKIPFHRRGRNEIQERLSVNMCITKVK